MSYFCLHLANRSFISSYKPHFLHASKVIYQGVLLTGQVQLCQTRDGQNLPVGIFLYFSLKQKPLFTNNLGHIWFPFRKYFLEKIIYKNCNFKPCCYFTKSVLLRKYVNKGCNFLNSYVLTVLLSIPFNKLPLEQHCISYWAERLFFL